MWVTRRRVRLINGLLCLGQCSFLLHWNILINENHLLIYIHIRNIKNIIEMLLFSQFFVLLHNTQCDAVLWNILKHSAVSKEQFCIYEAKGRSLLKLQWSQLAFVSVYPKVFWVCTEMSVHDFVNLIYFLITSCRGLSKVKFIFDALGHLFLGLIDLFQKTT